MSILIGQHSDFTWYLLLACNRHPHFFPSVSSFLFWSKSHLTSGIFPDFPRFSKIFPAFSGPHLVSQGLHPHHPGPWSAGTWRRRKCGACGDGAAAESGAEASAASLQTPEGPGMPRKKWPKNGKMMGNSLDFGVADFRNPIWVGI